jgi:hypothetical protein
MSHSFVQTNLIDTAVFTDDKPKSSGELNYSKMVRVVYYGTNGLRAIVQDMEGNLEDVKVDDMRIPCRNDCEMYALVEDSKGNTKRCKIKEKGELVSKKTLFEILDSKK